jgi:5-methylcytosine-specific restriction endonuclease McrA
LPIPVTCKHGITPKKTCIECRREGGRRSYYKHFDAEKKHAAYMANKDKHIVASMNARAKRLGIPGTFTLEYWLSIKTKCTYCGATQYPLEIDHIIPIGKGGSNYPENIHSVCQFCNRSKHSFSEEEFLEWLNWLRAA